MTLRNQVRYYKLSLKAFIFGKLVPIETALVRKSGYVSTQWLTTFYGSYRASRYFKNEPPPPPVYRWRWSRTGAWKRIPEWMMPVFAPFNTYRKTMRGESFMRGTKVDGD